MNVNNTHETNDEEKMTIKISNIRLALSDLIKHA